MSSYRAWREYHQIVGSATAWIIVIAVALKMLWEIGQWIGRLLW